MGYSNSLFLQGRSVPESGNEQLTYCPCLSSLRVRTRLPKLGADLEDKAAFFI